MEEKIRKLEVTRDELIDMVKSGDVESLKNMLSPSDDSVFVLYELELLRSLLISAGMFAETSDEMRDAIFEASLSKVNFASFADGLLTVVLTPELMDKNLIPQTLYQALLDDEWTEGALKSIQKLTRETTIAVFWYMIELRVTRINREAAKALTRRAYELEILDKRAMMLILSCSLDAQMSVIDALTALMNAIS